MPGVPSDELIGDVVQVIAYHVRLRANSQNVVSDAFDQRGLPAGSYGAESVPCVAGYKTELGRLGSKLFRNISISLARWLMVLHTIRAKSSFEQIDDATVVELPSLHFEQIIREREEPKTCAAQLA